MKLEKHNEIIREKVQKLYKDDLRRSLLHDEREESFKLSKSENKIIATRKIKNVEEKYEIEIETKKMNGNFSALLDDNFIFLGNCKNGKLEGLQKLINNEEIIWEIEMEEGKVREKKILKNNEIQKNGEIKNKNKEENQR